MVAFDTKRIKQYVDQIAIVAERASKVELNFEPLPEDALLSERVALGTVDGGQITKNLAAASLMVCSAAGLVYCPGQAPHRVKSAEFEMLHDMSVFEQLVGVLRTRLEIQAALGLIEEGAKIILIDGSLAQLFEVGGPTKKIQVLINYILSQQRKKGPLATALAELADDLSSAEDSQLDDNVDRISFARAAMEYDRFNDALRELLFKVKLNNVVLLGLAKDSYSTSLVRSLNRVDQAAGAIDITDTGLLSIIAGQLTGYTQPLATKLRIHQSARNFLNAKSKLPDEYQRVHTFYLIAKENGIPIRVDVLDAHKDGISDHLAQILPYADATGWFIPPQLAHIRGKMSKQLFDMVYHALLRTAMDSAPDVYQTFLKSSRRDAIQ